MRPGRAALRRLGVQLRGRPMGSEGTGENGNIGDATDEGPTAGRTADYNGYQNWR